MSEEQLKAFLERLKADTSLQEKLKAASDADAVASIAKEEGFMISADDLKNAQSEISDEELEGAAGGLCFAGRNLWTSNKGQCGELRPDSVAICETTYKNCPR